MSNRRFMEIYRDCKAKMASPQAFDTPQDCFKAFKDAVKRRHAACPIIPNPYEKKRRD